MKTRAYFRLHAIGLVIIFLIGTIVWTGCDKDGSPGSGSNNGSPPPPPPPPPLPDLAISTIQVYPNQPQAGQRFTLNIYVKNEGKAPSGKYDIAISIKDVSRGSTYPVGTFRKDGLRPGEDIPAYNSSNLLVNFPGSHQVHVEIKPSDFDDGNNQNNTKIWAFTVK